MCLFSYFLYELLSQLLRVFLNEIPGENGKQERDRKADQSHFKGAEALACKETVGDLLNRESIEVEPIGKV